MFFPISLSCPKSFQRTSVTSHHSNGAVSLPCPHYKEKPAACDSVSKLQDTQLVGSRNITRCLLKTQGHHSRFIFNPLTNEQGGRG